MLASEEILEQLVAPWLTTFTTALAKKLVVKAAAGTVRSISGRLDAVLASGSYYLQVWNRTDVPNDGTAFDLTSGLAASTKVVHVSGEDR